MITSVNLIMITIVNEFNYKESSMKKVPSVSEAEYEVMKVVWSMKTITSGEIIEKLSPKMDWNPQTVKTLINRLVKKKALNYTNKGKSYIYTAALSKEDCIDKESKSFLNRIFDGALMPMLTHFAKSNELSAEEIEQLNKILNGEK